VDQVEFVAVDQFPLDLIVRVEVDGRCQGHGNAEVESWDAPPLDLQAGFVADSGRF
jgi:hypothetical protein